MGYQTQQLDNGCSGNHRVECDDAGLRYVCTVDIALRRLAYAIHRRESLDANPVWIDVAATAETRAPRTDNDHAARDTSRGIDPKCTTHID